MAYIQICTNCEEKCTKDSTYCRNCNTSEKRKNMQDENNKIREAGGLQPAELRSKT